MVRLKGLGTDDALHVLRRIIDKVFWSADFHLLQTSMGFQKAYDKVFNTAIQFALHAWGIQGDFRNLVNSLLKSACVVLGLK